MGRVAQHLDVVRILAATKPTDGAGDPPTFASCSHRVFPGIAASGLRRLPDRVRGTYYR